ncbi:hypothetical protein [Streptomyces xylophagus]|uniref:hypothetical protein n=1 Tax=Streptomyces xylophagus TaxID=285514 RepID=UPI0005BD7DF7|nr:hypothetical protein [Streptomyces xylophagus]
MDTDELDWNRALREQWEVHCEHQLRARLDGVLAARNAAHFGAPTASYESWEYASSAATALDQIETQLDIWLTGVRGLGDAGRRVPVGEKEPFPDAPTTDLVLRIHRELIHHLSEVCLLRDLYLQTNPAAKGAPR